MHQSYRDQANQQALLLFVRRQAGDAHAIRIESFVTFVVDGKLYKYQAAPKTRLSRLLSSMPIAALLSAVLPAASLFSDARRRR